MRFEPKQWTPSDMKHSEHYGKWFVTAGADSFRYLHSDGEVRKGTYHGGLWSGFFLTRESAEAAIKAYRARQQEAKPWPATALFRS